MRKSSRPIKIKRSALKRDKQRSDSLAVKKTPFFRVEALFTPNHDTEYETIVPRRPTKSKPPSGAKPACLTAKLSEQKARVVSVV